MSTKVQSISEQAIDALDVAIKEYGDANQELGKALCLLQQAAARCFELDRRGATKCTIEERDAAVKAAIDATNIHWEAQRRVDLADYRVLAERRLQAAQRAMSERQAMVGVRR